LLVGHASARGANSTGRGIAALLTVS